MRAELCSQVPPGGGLCAPWAAHEPAVINWPFEFSHGEVGGVRLGVSRLQIRQEHPGAPRRDSLVLGFARWMAAIAK